MTNLNGFNLFLAAARSTLARFSSCEVFLDVLRIKFIKLPYEKSAVINKIDEIMADLSLWSTEKANSDLGAYSLSILLLDDFRKIRENVFAIATVDLEGELNEQFSLFKNRLSRLGVSNIDFPPLFIVDQYPEPVSKNIWFAASFFWEDELQYGMPRGIYFRRDMLSPNVSTMLLGHELVHFTMERKRKIIPRRFEEGICDLLGSCYLGGGVIGFHTVTNILRNILYNAQSDPLWWLYASNLLQAFQVYERYGFDGIAHIINQERKYDFIGEVERRILVGELINLDLPSSENEDTFFLNAIRSLVLYPSQFVVSPQTLLVLKLLIELGSLSLVRSQLPRHSDEQIDSIINEAGKFPLILLDNNGSVIAETASVYLDTGVLRYDVRGMEKLIS